MPEARPPALPGWLDRELPFGRSALQLDSGPDGGRLVHLLDHGHRLARVVLMQHGNPTWSFLWRKVIARLPPRRFRCVAPDLLGFGLSEKLPRVEDHSVDRHADVLAAVVEALDLRGIVLVGQDWGGPLVAALGARVPERIAGLVLANTSVLVPRRPRGTWFHRFARLPLISDLVFRGLGFPQNVLGRAQGDPASIDAVAARAYRMPFRSWADRAGPLALARMVPDGPGHPSVPALERAEAWIRAFRGPAALVWGLRDPILGRALRRHEEAFPDAPVTRTEAGHFLQEEVPGAIAAAIEEVTRRIPT
jgi:cis-3-alkyl-4-acyloxetan-2-one decarboxylase